MAYLKPSLLIIVLLLGLNGCVFSALSNLYNERLTDQIYQDFDDLLKKGVISKEQAVAECERLKAKTEKTNIQCVFPDAVITGSPAASK
jgi:hypothetical protein